MQDAIPVDDMEDGEPQLASKVRKQPITPHYSHEYRFRTRTTYFININSITRYIYIYMCTSTVWYRVCWIYIYIYIYIIVTLQVHNLSITERAHVIMDRIAALPKHPVNLEGKECWRIGQDDLVWLLLKQCKRLSTEPVWVPGRVAALPDTVWQGRSLATSEFICIGFSDFKYEFLILRLPW